jgi:hypothetical protein
LEEKKDKKNNDCSKRESSGILNCQQKTSEKEAKGENERKREEEKSRKDEGKKQ